MTPDPHMEVQQPDRVEERREGTPEVRRPIVITTDDIGHAAEELARELAMNLGELDDLDDW